MNVRLIRLAALALIASLAISSCASTKDGRLAQGQGTVGGAIAGACVGLLLGGVTGNWKNAAVYAAVGAVRGGGAGFGYGTLVAQKKAQYARQEDFLDYAVAQAEKNNADAMAANQQLINEVRSFEKRSGTVPDTKSKKMWLNESQIQLSAIDKQSGKLDAQIKDYKACLSGEGYGSKSQSAVLRSKIKGLESQKAVLLQYKTRLASAQTRIAI